MFKLVVLSSVLALVAASPSTIGLGLGGLGLAGLAGPIAAPLAAPIAASLAAPIATPLAAPITAPWGTVTAHGVAVAPAIAAVPVLGHGINYRGPLSLAPGQPANILAADGRPLDTLSVNLDRAAHLTARAVNGGHLLRKRSAPLLAPALPAVHAAWPAAAIWPAARVGLSAPIGAPWGVGAIGHAGLIGHLG
ncbi:unnamed protein product [Diatraea saccharalis]|uniref:Cuticle protein n=1 Tax=Diatraea saccharalis TaxID=40085 RepID=A0A9N9RCA7_9NEOP|nr:unnamed protein product [Diatraea saccharalis]